MKPILFPLFFILSQIPFSATASGRTVGNGGDVIVCDGTLDHKPVELLDFYEGQSLRGIQVELGAETLSIAEKIERALARLDRVSPTRARKYREQAASFFSETLFLKDAHLVDIPDSDHIAISSISIDSRSRTKPIGESNESSFSIRKKTSCAEEEILE